MKVSHEDGHEFSPATYDWLRLAEHPPVPADWVPGANTRELSALNALGGIASGLLPTQSLMRLPAVVTEWIGSSPTPPSDVLADASRAFTADPDRSLADAYARLVRASNRRRLGTFFTPAPEVKLMLDMWDANQPQPATVIDVGAGVGVFTAAAAKQWPDADVVAVDINPVTLGLLAVRLYRHNITTYKNVTLHHGDFTKDLFEQPAFRRPRRLILGNPPYTRAQLLPVPERKRLEALSGGLCNSRASLSTSITAMSLLDLDATDGLCLLLPAQWLEADYARELRTALWRSQRRRIELRLVESSMFDGALVDAVALLVSPETPHPGMFVSRWSHGADAPLERSGNTCPPNWRNLFDAPSLEPTTESGGQEGTSPVRPQVTLGSLAKIRRGVATGANQFFVFSAAEKADAGLDKYLTRKIVVRLRDMPGALHTSECTPDVAHRWLLQATRMQVQNDVGLAKYIQSGEADHLDDRYLCARRGTWYDLTQEVSVPDVIVAPMARDQFRVVVNDSDATITNNLYGLTWLDTTPEKTRHSIVEWLRSDHGQSALRGVARQQGNHLMKIEPRALQQLALPDHLTEIRPGEVSAPSV